MGLFNFVTGFLAGRHCFSDAPPPTSLPGAYGGVYLAQNYKVPVASDPATIVENIGAWLDTLKKDKGKKDD
jgi:hypothetical protein